MVLVVVDWASRTTWVNSADSLLEVVIERAGGVVEDALDIAVHGSVVDGGESQRNGLAGLDVWLPVGERGRGAVSADGAEAREHRHKQHNGQQCTAPRLRRA